jgi:hypothetical protein
VAFYRKKNGNYTACLKYLVWIFVEQIFKMQRLEVSGAVRRCGAWRSEISDHHATRHNTPIHNILSTAPQLSISQKTLETLPEDNVMPKHIGATIHN